MVKVVYETKKVSPLSNLKYQTKTSDIVNQKTNSSYAKYSCENFFAYHLTKLPKVSFQSSQKALNIKLGSNYNSSSGSVEFGVFSKKATRIQLEIFDKPVGGKSLIQIPLNKDKNKWYASLSANKLKELGINIKEKEPIYYGFRAWGPNFDYDKNWMPGSYKGFKAHVDENGNRFNPNKLLVDPYAREISHDPVSPKYGVVDESVYKTGDKNFLKDSSLIAPKSIFVISDKVDFGIKPKREIKDDVIYETHIRGLTMNDKSIPKEYRGTYKGASLKAKYLKELGVTMVEFLPIQEFGNEQNDYENYNHNYWGYMTLGYFAPDRRYAFDKRPGGPTKEFKEMVKAFHDEGIKVAMDVVYNHTGEGGVFDKKGEVVNLFSMMGLDTSSYYETTKDNKEFCNNSGCGANFNIANPDAQKLVIDSIKYWSDEMGVDAFRHDLASVLGNIKEKDGYYFDANDSRSYIKSVTKELKVRDSKTKEGIDLIAEPWGCGENTYQLGNFPKQWSEWNDTYRDSIRKYLNQQERTPFAIVARAISGSQKKFHKTDYTRSINFVTAHDGFTMKDMVSYNNKVNKGFYGISCGGSDNNISWNNQGSEINQRKAIRNALTMLMISKGTPMIVGGDEILRTTLGNNNPWNQDKPFNWINWHMDDDKIKMFNFTKGLIEFRKKHPALRNADFYASIDKNNNGLKSVTWLKSDAQEAKYHYFDNPNNSYLGMRIDETEYDDCADSIYVAMNKGDNTIGVELPKNLPNKSWYIVANTSEYLENKYNIMPEGKEVKIDQNNVISGPRSIMLFVEK